MMEWIVVGEKDGGKIRLVSKGERGILPKGSFLTVVDGGRKFILRVDDSKQVEPYTPSPLIVEVDLPGLSPDLRCTNEVIAYRVKDVDEREDGLVDFIHPLSKAYLSTQSEVDSAIEVGDKGPRVFVSTIHANQNRILRGPDGKRISVCLPEDMFFHQMMICGKTGSGKTVAMKYLAKYFAENMNGAVLAINVKDIDFLQMDQPSNSMSDSIQSEWDDLGIAAEGMYGVTMYMPANRDFKSLNGVTHDICEKITLDVNKVQPEALTGLLQGISDKGALTFPSIFNYWRNDCRDKGIKPSFRNFIEYFNCNEDRRFRTLSERGDENITTLHSSTYDNISRALNSVNDFFDNEDAKSLEASDILEHGKLSILDFSGPNGPKFGSILLRDLLKKIVDEKDKGGSKVPVLIIIDEVHQFYGDTSATEALGDLDTICRTGRSKEIAVMFASQNPSDMPKGISSVINTKIFFKSDSVSTKDAGVRISPEEFEGLKQGFAVVQIHGVPQLRVVKFPLSPCGVVVK